MMPPPPAPDRRDDSDSDIAAGVAMIDRLVGFDTTSRESNLDLIRFVRTHLAEHGIQAAVLTSPDGHKANLLATIGPMVEGGVVLSGHTDVVPVDGQDWDTDPFVLTERNGRLYGRGTADMKSFSALALALVPDMLAADLKRPIHLALSYDEEVGCLGVPALIRAIRETLPTPQAVIVGEPTSMRVVGMHKGIRAYQVDVHGREAHSSQPHRAVSAVMTACGLVHWLGGRAAERAARPLPDSAYDPPYTTITAEVIEGGTAHNIIARHCRFVWTARTVAEDDPDALERAFLDHAAAVEADLQAIAPEARIETTRLAAVPALRHDPHSAADRLVRSLTGDNGTGAVSFAAEAGHFQEAGFATIMCGPGSIDQAHQPNESITLDQVRAGTAFLQRLIAHLAA